jgi:hypothetical protein
MTIFFGFTLVDSVVPENAIMYKQTLVREQAFSLINQGVKPLGHSQQALTNIVSKLGINISNTTTCSSVEELSVGDSVLVLTTEHGCTEDVANAESKFTLWTRLA